VVFSGARGFVSWFISPEKNISYKVKTITSPTAAVTLDGLKVRVPLPPTVTGISAAETAVATAKRLARAAERRMLTAGTQSTVRDLSRT